MGVVNVTPDSFSDGGQWFGAAAAIEHGLELVAQGADIVDVGGESTRPGAQRVPADEELRRVRPVITELIRAGAVVSVDTMRAQVAEWALEAGVSLVNDVSGGLADPYMPRLVAKAGPVYGSFATVAGMFALLYLVGQALVYAAEVAAVRYARLWPRAVDLNRPTEADARALALLAREQERIPAARVAFRLAAPGSPPAPDRSPPADNSPG